MNRRRVVAAIGAAGLAGHVAIPRAQLVGTAMPRIGVLSFGTAPSGPVPDPNTGFRQRLRELGLIEEGENLVTEWRFAEGEVARLDGLADELVRLKVELIVAFLNDSIAAAQRPTSTIPIVMFSAGVPVEVGFVASPARPRGIITGTAWAPTDTAAKILQILKEVAPGTARVASLSNPTTPGVQDYRAATMRAASALDMSLQHFDLAQPTDMTAALDRIAASRIDGLYVGVDAVVGNRLNEVVAFALRHKLVSIGTSRLFVDAGGALSCGPDVVVVAQRTVSFIDRILKGARPADLPVELPTKLELVINLRTAKALGLTIPQSLLLRADEVIE
jgi:putative tryptophan/tyrosine transport system substrate-binding protein